MAFRIICLHGLSPTPPLGMFGGIAWLGLWSFLCSMRIFVGTLRCLNIFAYFVAALHGFCFMESKAGLGMLLDFTLLTRCFGEQSFRLFFVALNLGDKNWTSVA